MKRISACLITLNDAHNLPLGRASLASVTDEILDGTVTIAKQHSVAE